MTATCDCPENLADDPPDQSSVCGAKLLGPTSIPQSVPAALFEGYHRFGSGPQQVAPAAFLALFYDETNSFFKFPEPVSFPNFGASLKYAPNSAYTIPAGTEVDGFADDEREHIHASIHLSLT